MNALPASSCCSDWGLPELGVISLPHPPPVLEEGTVFLLLKQLLHDLLLNGNRVVLGTLLNLKLRVRNAQERWSQP